MFSSLKIWLWEIQAKELIHFQPGSFTYYLVMLFFFFGYVSLLLVFVAKTWSGVRVLLLLFFDNLQISLRKSQNIGVWGLFMFPRALTAILECLENLATTPIFSLRLRYFYFSKIKSRTKIGFIVYFQI